MLDADTAPPDVKPQRWLGGAPLAAALGLCRADRPAGGGLLDHVRPFCRPGSGTSCVRGEICQYAFPGLVVAQLRDDRDPPRGGLNLVLGPTSTSARVQAEKDSTC
jgi:hypothetical protein